MAANTLVFNSVVFLFCFMPLALGLYYLVPARIKNAVLLAESLIFFCWAGVSWLPLIVILIAAGYLGGLAIERMAKGPGRRAVLAVTVIVCAAALVFCKYTNFLIETIDILNTHKIIQAFRTRNCMKIVR